MINIWPFFWTFLFTRFKVTTVIIKVYPIYLFKFNIRNTNKRFETCSSLTLKTPELRSWRRSGVFLLTIKLFHTVFWCFYCYVWTGKYLLEHHILSRMVFNSSAKYTKVYMYLNFHQNYRKFYKWVHGLKIKRVW